MQNYQDSRLPRQRITDINATRSLKRQAE
jgi:hypothetical protein